MLNLQHSSSSLPALDLSAVYVAAHPFHLFHYSSRAERAPNEFSVLLPYVMTRTADRGPKDFCINL